MRGGSIVVVDFSPWEIVFQMPGVALLVFHIIIG